MMSAGGNESSKEDGDKIVDLFRMATEILLCNLAKNYIASHTYCTPSNRFLLVEYCFVDCLLTLVKGPHCQAESPLFDARMPKQMNNHY
jgi:hypothetical protein